eukprot:gene3987-biopygen12340
MILSPSDSNHGNTIFVRFWGWHLQAEWGAVCGLGKNVVHGHGSFVDTEWSPMLQGMHWLFRIIFTVMALLRIRTGVLGASL